MKVFLPGRAGLVGHNLIALLREVYPDWKLLVVDKKQQAIAVGQYMFPEFHFFCQDLADARTQSWPALVDGWNACVIHQSQIGNTDPLAFHRNNITSTGVILDQLVRRRIPDGYRSAVPW